MKTITLITGNNEKREIAEKVLSKYNIVVETATLDHDENYQEAQLWDCGEIALHQARYAASKLNKPVLTTDVGYYFETFGKGFPGPYVKWFNEGLTVQDMLKLMEGKENRRVIIKEALAYCDPKGNEKAFIVEDIGRISYEPSKNKSRYPVNEILILKGLNKPIADYDKEKIFNYWVCRDKHYIELAEYLKRIWNKLFLF